MEYNQGGGISYIIFTNDGVQKNSIFVPDNYTLEVEQLGRCILGDEKPFVTPEFSVKNAELMDRVLKETGYYKD